MKKVRVVQYFLLLVGSFKFIQSSSCVVLDRVRVPRSLARNCSSGYSRGGQLWPPPLLTWKHQWLELLKVKQLVLRPPLSSPLIYPVRKSPLIGRNSSLPSLIGRIEYKRFWLVETFKVYSDWLRVWRISHVFPLRATKLDLSKGI